MDEMLEVEALGMWETVRHACGRIVAMLVVDLAVGAGTDVVSTNGTARKVSVNMVGGLRVICEQVWNEDETLQLRRLAFPVEKQTQTQAFIWIRPWEW